MNICCYKFLERFVQCIMERSICKYNSTLLLTPLTVPFKVVLLMEWSHYGGWLTLNLASLYLELSKVVSRGGLFIGVVFKYGSTLYWNNMLKYLEDYHLSFLISILPTLYWWKMPTMANCLKELNWLTFFKPIADVTKQKFRMSEQKKRALKG